MKYKVFFHRGDELSLKTRSRKGERGWVTLGCMLRVQIDSQSPSGEILDVELFRLHGLGLVIRIEHKGGRLFLSVVRLMLGQFAIINFLRTGTLQKQLASVAKPR